MAIGAVSNDEGSYKTTYQNLMPCNITRWQINSTLRDSTTWDLIITWLLVGRP